MTNEHAAEPLTADFSHEWPAGISLKNPHLGDIPTGPHARGRRYDWVGAAMAMGVGLSPAVAGSVVFEAVGAQPEAWWLVFLWLIGLGLALRFAWETWHGLLDERIFRVNSDQAVVSGRTGWPIGRHRWIRLDQLTRVSCRKVFEGYGFDTYFVLRDHAGAQLMLQYTPSTRSILLAVIPPPTGRAQLATWPAASWPGCSPGGAIRWRSWSS